MDNPICAARSRNRAVVIGLSIGLVFFSLHKGPDIFQPEFRDHGEYRVEAEGAESLQPFLYSICLQAGVRVLGHQERHILKSVRMSTGTLFFCC